MKDYARIIGKITSTPWLITPDALHNILEIFDAHVQGNLSIEEIQARVNAAGRRQGDIPPAQRKGKVGVLAITGPIFPKANLMTELSGATSMEQFRQDFRQMMNDDSVDALLLDVDSPGGLADQIEEMATEIREGRDTKPVYAIANTAANSAAYYLASQATRMYSTPSGQLGSVGTYYVHVNNDRQLEARGIDKTVIKAGRLKTVHEEPLSQEGRAYLQDIVNDTNDQFIKNVALGRNVSEDFVREHFGEGGIVTPTYAYNNKMIDGIKTFDQVVESIGSELGGGQLGIAARGEMDRNQSYDADKEHSEPGTGQGGEPTPREAPETGDPAIEGGWRRDPPPPAYEEVEEEQMDRTWLEARATSLGIEFNTETTDEEISEAVANRIDEIVVPLNTATVDAQKTLDFAKDYPEQAAELAAQREETRNHKAEKFAAEYARFEGSSKGYSTVVRDLIQSAHAKVALGQFTNDDLKQLLDATADRESSVVDWAESGSGREEEGRDSVAPTQDFQRDRQKFADLVSTAMTEDNLTRNAAIEHVSKQHPELARAYATGHVKR